MLAETERMAGPRGKVKPRVAPPLPARSLVREFEQAASDLGVDLMDWQRHAARYLMATAADGRWLYREIAIVVARQNGKTTLLQPLIIHALRQGLQVLHTAQDRALPRRLFEDLVRKVRDWSEVEYIRWANGQETIFFKSGGRYTLVAPNHGVRGHTADLVLQDEVRLQHDTELQQMILPTTIASPNPRTVYLSNAGDDDSVVLNMLRDRQDESLAYLEWSASPDRDIDDPVAWAEANPALGRRLTMEALRANRAAQTDNGFETEHLCRWVASARERLVSVDAWEACRVEGLPVPRRAFLGVSIDPDSTRASAALAWMQSDGKVALELVADVHGSPLVDVPSLVAELRNHHVDKVGFDPMSDLELTKGFRVTEAISAGKFANATSTFVRYVETGDLRWTGPEALSDDLLYTARKEHDQTGVFQAVRAKDDRPITAALAAIRAVWLASTPAKRGVARIY